MFPEVIDFVEESQISKEYMFQKQRESNLMTTYAFRLAGFLLLLFGVVMIFSPLIYLF